MSEAKSFRLSKVTKELNVGLQTIVEFLKKKGFNYELNPNAKISSEAYDELLKEFSQDSSIKKKSDGIALKNAERKTTITLDDIKEEESETQDSDEVIIKSFGVAAMEQPAPKEKETPQLKVVGKIDLEKKPKAAPKPKVEEEPEPVKPAKETKTVAAKKEKETKPKATKAKKEEELYSIPVENLGEKVKVVGMVDLDGLKKKKKTAKTEEVVETPVAEEVEATPVPEVETPVAGPVEQEVYRPEVAKLSGPKVIGNIELAEVKKKSPPSQAGPGGPKGSDADERNKKKAKRKRILKERVSPSETFAPKLSDEEKKTAAKPAAAGKGKKQKFQRNEISQQDVMAQMRDTNLRMHTKNKSLTSKHRRDKREAASQKMQEEFERKEGEKNILKITEFVSVNELATMMSAPVNEIIQTCMNLGHFVSINQRLDAEVIAIIAEEFGFTVEFITVDVQSDMELVEDTEGDIVPRPPIVTVMGHVDHGKTKLLDYIRNANVIAGEAGGITQHIGAYSVTLEDERQITFLDTPGHEAFTAMRARGAQITDVAIIMVAADDGVMPQTVEAINHAQAAGVPLVFAINKIDKPGANPDKIRETLSQMNILVEEWGGKFQSQEISAKQGVNINHLLDKVLLEAEMKDLKANPDKLAYGTVVESSLDKGRGFVANLLVKNGTLHIGDVVLAGSYYGKVKAMFNERNQRMKEAGPSMPVQIIGLNGAPQAGDKFNVLDSEHKAKEIANKRSQIIREQGLRTQKHITLEEIGRRIAIGNFKELNVIVKGDVDGSIEALSDSLIKLSNEEIQVNVIHKAVGQISESDVMLAAASNAIIIGFQVRPSSGARKVAEREEIQIRLYSIIYDAIEELKQAMEGMLSPVIKEEIIGSAEVRQVFKISKVGTIAGCFVTEGKIQRSAKVRLIRDGIVVYTGDLGSLKRFKDEAREVTSGLDCGLNIEKFNDIKEGDIVEAFTTSEVKKKL